MTVLSRGARVRRGGRRPGSALLTALLVLAIGASSALVFTDRVELLKLAVILALWAVVVAAFVSVIYRRQSDVAQARARDMKLIYDLQLDREISARREYELAVESQLRRELASELRAESADEIVALRNELSALRTNLEILFGAELEHRPALEHDRSTVHAISDRAAGTGGSAEWAASSRIDAELADDGASRTTENPIIDVREVAVPAAQPEQPAHPAAELFGSARHTGEGGRRSRRRRAEVDQPQPAHRHEAATAQYRPIDREPLPPPQPQPWQPAAPPPAAPQPPVPPPAPPPPPSTAWYPPPAEPGWQPVGAEGQWLPPEAPGSHWAGPVEEPPPPPVAEPRVGRHYGPPEPQPGYAPPMPTRPEPVARHRGAEEPAEPAEPTSRRSSGQSVADLLARFQVDPSTGGGRRRRRNED